MTIEETGSEEPNVSDSLSSGDDEKGNEQKSETFRPPTDGSWIPRERFDHVLDTVRELKDSNTELKAAIETKTQPELPSRQELLDSVAEGKLTQAEADGQWEQQIRRDVLSSVRDEVKANSAATAIGEGISAYEAKLPELQDEASETYKRVRQEYQYLLTLGQPDNKATVLAAIRSVVGPIEGMNRAAPEPKYDTHTETGSGGNAQNETRDQKLKWGDLTPRQKDHYTRAINAGGYADRDEALAELNAYKSR